MEISPKLKLALLSQTNTEQGLVAITALFDVYRKNHASAPKVPKPRIGYLASQPDPDRIYYRETQALYHELGADLVCYLDLEQGFSAQGLSQLLACDGIHLSGGDTYRFLKHLKVRNLSQSLTDYALEGKMLIGLSAGAMIITPGIVSAVLCGDENQVGLNDLSGLNLVPFQFVPHVAPSLRGDKNQIEEMALDAQRLGISQSIYLCTDEQAIVICDGMLSSIGEPYLLEVSSICGSCP